jgi:DNA-binding MltR family transcriptional regulator
MGNESEMDDHDFEDALDLLVPGTKGRAKRLFEIRSELEKESDRGCALVAAAYLENQITELLEGFFIQQSKKASGSLFDFNGPVGTFSSKIKMCLALGLIPKEISNALDLVRKIRNEFAHLHEPLRFDTESMARRVVSLLPEISVENTIAREAFISKIQSMAATLHLCISNTFSRSTPEYESVPIKENAEDQEIEIAARRLIKCTAPDITYEQAIDMAKRFRKIK